MEKQLQQPVNMDPARRKKYQLAQNRRKQSVSNEPQETSIDGPTSKTHTNMGHQTFLLVNTGQFKVDDILRDQQPTHDAVSNFTQLVISKEGTLPIRKREYENIKTQFGLYGAGTQTPFSGAVQQSPRIETKSVYMDVNLGSPMNVSTKLDSRNQHADKIELITPEAKFQDLQRFMFNLDNLLDFSQDEVSDTPTLIKLTEQLVGLKLGLIELAIPTRLMTEMLKQVIKEIKVKFKTIGLDKPSPNLQEIENEIEELCLSLKPTVKQLIRGFFEMLHAHNLETVGSDDGSP